MKSRPTHADLAGARYLALQRLARAQGRATAELLQLYVLESFLRRLVRSRHDERLVLKGGLLLAAFDLRRATRDVDLLALRTDNDPQAVERLIVDVASVEVDDGVVFLPDTIVVGTIRDGDVYPGVRAVLEARLATARVTMSVDVNVGDPVVPAPTRTAVPGLLGDDRIHVLAYPRAMVIAEKLVTALQRGRASTRWRDFADLFVLVRGVVSEAEVIDALRAVAVHRGASLAPLADVLSGMPTEAQRHWSTWRTRHGAEARVPDDFAAVLDALDLATRGWLVEAAKGGAAVPRGTSGET
jgi:predicted nucleotidyltransferase component of viral defense system